MTVTFNDVELANGESRTAKVAAGLAPSGQLGMEMLEFLRADWAVPVARGNRIMTLPMIIQIPAFESFGLSLVSGLMYFASLPEEGPLVIREGDLQVTFSNAVCTQCKIIDEIVGVSYDVALTFACGEPVNATLSPLALMDARYTANLSAITGLTGGTATDLDGLITADVAVGFLAHVFVPIATLSQLAVFRLQAGTDATNTDPLAGPVVVRPADYDAGTNAKVWMRLDA